MNWPVWQQIEAFMIQKGVKPILSVVPDNRDPELCVDAPASDFWDRVRGWQERGWTIALHGHQHTYITRQKGMMGCSPRSEFAGLPREQQGEKLNKAVSIFRSNGIEPKVWVAPSHSFDATTLALLRELGLKVISDGQSRKPYLYQGFLWISVQLNNFKFCNSGIWTVNYHHNGWNHDQLQNFFDAVHQFGNCMTDLNCVMQRYGGRKKTMGDKIEEIWGLWKWGRWHS